MTESIRDAIAELERAYDALAPLFDGVNNWRVYRSPGSPPVSDQLLKNRPIITIQTKKLRVNEKPVHSWYVPKIWVSESKEALAILAGEKNPTSETGEINITPEGLDRPASEILTSLLKEMVHHYAQLFNTFTLSPEGYHSNLYAQLAGSVGLQTRNTGAKGWNEISAISKKASDLFENIALDPTAFEVVRKKPKKVEYKGSKLKKWSCKCTNARVATMLEAVCLHCGAAFEYTDKDADTQVPYIEKALNWHDQQSNYYSDNKACKRISILQKFTPVPREEEDNE